jgi:hypothetical protein
MTWCNDVAHDVTQRRGAHDGAIDVANDAAHRM